MEGSKSRVKEEDVVLILFCLLVFLCRCREKAKKRKGKDKDTPSSPTEEAESNQFDDFKDLPPVRAVAAGIHMCILLFDFN